MPKFIDNLKSILSNKKGNQSNKDINNDSNVNETSILETDAAPVPDDDDSYIDSNYSEQSRTSSISSQLSNLNLQSLQRQESLTPLKQHRIVEATTTCTDIAENNNQQLVPNSHYENNRVSANTTHASLTQGHTVIQISNANGVHIGNVITHTSLTQNNVTEPISPGSGTNGLAAAGTIPSGLRKSSSSQSNNGYTNTKTISEMMKSSLTVDEKFIDVISTHLINWKDIARKLDFTDGQIDHFYLDNNAFGTKETIYQMLLDWKRNVDDPTLGILTKILWRNNNQEAVIQLKPLYKAKKNELLPKTNPSEK